MMKTKQLQTLLTAIAVLITMMFALPQQAQAQAKEAYVAKSTDGKTLTFYYDAQRTARTGTTYDIDQKRADDKNAPAWAGTYSAPDGTLTKANFDASFKDFKPTSTYRWFCSLTALHGIEGMENLNTENVTDMRSMFSNCPTLTSLDVSKLNTANVTSMYDMFFNCKALTSLDVSNFNTAKVNDMSSMFSNCLALTSLDLSKFNTANVTTMRAMFSNCSALALLNVSNFNTENVVSMSEMFSDCTVLTSLDLSNFNTAKVINMSKMFSYCFQLTSLDLSNFNTENVTNMESMFSNCRSLTSLNLSSFNTAKVTNMKSMFSNCYSLTSLDLSNFNTANVTLMPGMFSNCTHLVSLDLSNFNTANVTNMQSMFANCYYLPSLNLSNFNTANVTNMKFMFCNCSYLTTIYCDRDWMSDKVINFEEMFINCWKLRGAVPYNGRKVGIEMANPTTGYFMLLYVDLGLSVKWATCNLGASKTSDNGDYYAWGETEPNKAKYSSATYKWGTTDNLAKYNATDGKTTLDPEDDAATAKLGSAWRIPTSDEIKELIDKCTWTWTSQDGKKGYEVKGPNGNTIFLPVAGRSILSVLNDADSWGYYWSSSLDTDNSIYAHSLKFSSYDHAWHHFGRYLGFTVRPVYVGISTGIASPTVGVLAKKRGIYNLQGLKMQGSFDSLPAGIYIVDGRKVVKK